MVLKAAKVSELTLQGGIGKHTPIITGKTLVKVGADGVRISVVSYTKVPKNATYLLGHEKPVSSLSLSPNGTFILCSCSEDRIILWNLSPFKYGSKEMSTVNKGLVIGEYIGCVLCCNFSWSMKWLVLCQAKELWVVLLKENIFKSDIEDGFSLHAILKTDSSRIDMCSFSPQYHNIFVTIEEGNHFQVWDISSGNITYRSTTFINSKIKCCSYGGMPNKLLIGTNKGIALAYQVNEKLPPSPFINLSISEENFMHGPENDGYISPNTEQSAIIDECLHIKKGCTVFSMEIYNRKTSLNECNSSVQDDTKLAAEKMLKSIISPGSVLMICCSLGIIMYDCKSCECFGSVLFTEIKMLPDSQFSLIEDIIQTGESFGSLECWIKTSTSDSKLYHINFECEEALDPNSQSENTLMLTDNQKDFFVDKSVDLSFLPSVPLNKRSPLFLCMKSQNKTLYASGLSKVNPKRTNAVKSSGYGNAPRKIMFIPLTNENERSKTLEKAKKNLSTHLGHNCCHGRSALCYGPPEKLVKDMLISETTGTAIKLAFSGNGCQIACNSTPTQLCIIPMNRICMEKSTILPGHNSSITSLGFNLSSKWLLSSSTDSTVKIWNWRSRKCIMKINVETKISPGTKSDYRNCPVTQASFFYLDKYILVASKDQLQLYSHSLKENSSFGSWSEEGLSQKVKTINFPTKFVNCFSATNQFHSLLIKDLVMAGCSNRSIMVYDLNHQKMARILRNAHLQHQPHCLVQQTGSVCPSIPALASESYNLFLSTAINDGVKLWDLRTPACVQKYNRHVNRMYASGMDFSSCSRFVAVSSEDKKIYLYDTRDCENYLCQLRGFSDVPMDVVFSPCMTQLVVSALNGHMFTFTNSNT